MCKFASFVLTKDKIFWSENSDSHEYIIKEFGLYPDGSTGPNILPVEITPSMKIKSLTDFDNWDYRVDQDILPEWYDKEREESRTRKALIVRFKKEFKVGGSLDLSGCTGLKSLPDNLKVGGCLNLSGCTGLKSLPDNLKVGGSLYLFGCIGLKSLPDNLKVGRSLYLSDHLK
jgi:hypothetical protein